MSLPNQLIVSGAGTAAVNGTYTKGADINGNPAWYSENTNTSNGGVGVLYIVNNNFIGGGPESGKYETRIRDTALTYYRHLSETPITSPVGLVYGAIGSGIAPAPTVTAAGGGGGGGSSPTFKVAADANVKIQGKVKIV